jgi:amidohydrolase
MTTLLQRAVAFEPDLVELRRDLHRHPELSFQETRTAAEAARRVEELGFAVQTGIARTGVVAELANGNGPIVALRADMDALPIRETSDVPYRSTVDGVMHACGHDAHVAMLVGAARLLRSARDQGELPAGTVRLLFQPSEERADRENKSGATRMIEQGALQGVSAIFGLHVGAHLPAGQIYISDGPVMAGSDTFTAMISGRSAHAARPHESVDAILLAAHVIMACQHAVARNIAPSDEGVLTIGQIQGGTAENIIAGQVGLRGTVRYFEEHVRGSLHRSLHNACRMVESLGGRCKVDVLPGNPPVVNDRAVSELARQAARDAIGDDVVQPFAPMMGAEDFAFFQRVTRGCFLWVGAALDPPREHHTPKFDIDERVLARGAAVMASCALHALRQPPH